MDRLYTVLILCLTTSYVTADYIIYYSADLTVVIGATAYFNASVYDQYNNPAEGEFRYTWQDDASHSYTHESTSYKTNWSVTYDPLKDSPGKYRIYIDFERKDWLGLYERLGRRTFDINVTAHLHGEIDLHQGSQHRSELVATNSSLTTNITLGKRDLEYLTNKKPRVYTYWFQDCEYMGVESGLVKNLTFPKADDTHYIEALVVALPNPPPPPPPPPTTTVAPTTTTTAAPNTTTTTTTPKPSPSTTVAPTTSTTTTLKPNVTATSLPIPHDDTLEKWLTQFKHKNGTPSPPSGFCLHTNSIPLTINTTYGYFNKQFVTKDAVKITKINGTNWIKNGDMVQVNISCSGSGPFEYCVQLATGEYNVTGNETCAFGKAKAMVTCGLTFTHFFLVPQQYTLVFIMSNSISKLVTPVGVNVYEVTKQPQISVIVIPVVSSIIVVTVIVFGIAYFIQSRRTFTIEVADFDFGPQPSELDYKTFGERLRESVLHSFFRANYPDSDKGSSPSRRYGSMQ